MAIKFIVLHCGYVESAQISPLMFEFTGHSTFTETEALTNLAHALFDKFREDTGLVGRPTVLQCCSEATTNYCPTCGRRAGKNQANFDDFAEFVTNLVSATADSFGEELLEWQPWFVVSDINKDELLELHENGEKKLVAALNPDLLGTDRKNHEKWCKRNERSLKITE